MAQGVKQPSDVVDTDVSLENEFFTRAIHEPQGTAGLAGKVVLLAGGNSSSARALAAALAQRGADIVLTCHRKAEWATVYLQQQIIEMGRRCVVMVGDAQDALFVDEVMAELRRSFGHLDAFVDYSAETAVSAEVPRERPVFPNLYLMKQATALTMTPYNQ